MINCYTIGFGSDTLDHYCPHDVAYEIAVRMSLEHERTCSIWLGDEHCADVTDGKITYVEQEQE